MADQGYLEKLYKGRPVRILMMGPIGTGKSSTGNTILGEKYFLSKLGSHSVTRRATYRSKNRFGRVVSIVDTPGVCNTTMTDTEFQNAIVQSYIMCSPGPHALLIVLNLNSRFADECKKTIDFIKWHLSQQVFDHAIIVLTHEDDLKHDGQDVQQYLNTATKDLSELLKICNQRYVPFDNRSQGEEQVKLLFDLIDKTVEMNKGHYTNKLFEQLEKRIQSKGVKTLMAKKAYLLRVLRNESSEQAKQQIKTKAEAENKRLGRDLEEREMIKIDTRIKQKYEHVVIKKTKSINDEFRKEMDVLELRKKLIKKLENEDMVPKKEFGRKVLQVLKTIGIGFGGFLGGVLAAPFGLDGEVLVAILTPIFAVISIIEFDDDNTESEDDIKDFVENASKSLEDDDDETVSDTDMEYFEEK